MREENIKVIEEFEKRFVPFTFNNGGALELTLWDVVDDRVHPENEVGIEIQNFILETLTTYRAQVLEEERKRIDTLSEEASEYPNGYSDGAWVYLGSLKQILITPTN